MAKSGRVCSSAIFVHFVSFILVVKPRSVRKENLIITVLAKNSGLEFGGKTHKTAGLVAQNCYWTRKFVTRLESNREEHYLHSFTFELFFFNKH